MGNLLVGTDTQATNSLSQVDSIIPVVVTASVTLIPGVHRLVYVDPSAGDITLTLPTAMGGQIFEIIRTDNGNNVVTVAGSIGTNSNGAIIGFQNQWIKIVGNSGDSTYQYLSLPPSHFATLSRTTPANFSAPASFGKYTAWETILAATAGVLTPSLTNDEIVQGNFEGVVQMGYRIGFSMGLEATNNKICSARLVFNGTGGDIVLDVDDRNGLGAGKPLALKINGDYGITEAGTFRIDVQGEGGDTWAVSRAKFDVARVVS